MPEGGKGAINAQDQSPLVSRRTFLIAASGAAIAATGGLAAYEMLRDKRTPEQIETDEGIAKLHEYVGELEDSPIKRDLQAYVLPIFSNPKPDFIQTSEGRIPVSGRRIMHRIAEGVPNDPAEYNGGLVIISDPPTDRARTVEAKTFSFPLPNFMTELELAQQPAENIEGRNLLLTVNIDEGLALDSAISPLITVNMLDPKSQGVDERTFRSIEKMIYLKEALGLLYYLKFHEEVSAQLRSQGLDRTVKTRDSSGNTSEVDITTGVLAGIDRNAGRFLALMDLGSYYLMFRILNDTNAESVLRRDPIFADALDNIDDFRQDDGIENPYHEATQWALTSPTASQLYHTGDLNKIP